MGDGGRAGDRVSSFAGGAGAPVCVHVVTDCLRAALYALANESPFHVSSHSGPRDVSAACGRLSLAAMPGCGAMGPVLKHGPRSYTLPRVNGARSSARKSPNPQRAAKASLSHTTQRARAGPVLLRGSGTLPAARPSGPGPRALGARAVERQSVYPRGGDLCVARTKPRETLVEVRRGIDVQIIPQSCVLGRKTHRTTS